MPEEQRDPCPIEPPPGVLDSCKAAMRKVGAREVGDPPASAGAPVVPGLTENAHAAEKFHGMAMEKPTPASIKALVVDTEFHNWAIGGRTMISCAILLHNGHMYVDSSRPIDAADFDMQRGMEEAQKKALAQCWDAEISNYRTYCQLIGKSL